MQRGILRTIVMMVITLLIGVTVILFILLVPQWREQEAQGAFIANLSYQLPTRAVQFYPNMRFAQLPISYSIGEACNVRKRADIKEALAQLEGTTPLRFVENKEGDISYACSQLKLPADQPTHFVAGEAVPTKIVNASAFYIIESANVSLFRDETCSTPQVALHETLHALGFDHTSNETSIMFPITRCDQTLDASMSDTLTQLYTIPSYADVVIVNLSANVSNGYLSFESTIANRGLALAETPSLMLRAGDFEKTFALGSLPYGKATLLSAQHISFPRARTNISFIVMYDGAELSVENNYATILLKENA